MADPGCRIIDCRFDLADPSAGYRTYLESHIANAVYADLHEDLSGPPRTDHGRHPMPDANRLKQLFTSLGISNRRQVVAYDDASGSVAARLWWMLHYMGHESVAVLDGGWQAWLDAGLPVEQEERKNAPEPFQGDVKQSWLVTLDQVLAQPLLVDAREPARYRGEHEPIDPVAGHIPGAVNHYWKDNLTAAGHFLAPVQIRQVLLDYYAGISPGEVTFYCGSGVTACHNLLAAAYAGLPAGRLYAGSWSEWCALSDRPVATGEG